MPGTWASLARAGQGRAAGSGAAGAHIPCPAWGWPGSSGEASLAKVDIEHKIYFLWDGEGRFPSELMKKKPEQSLKPVLHWPKPMNEVI